MRTEQLILCFEPLRKLRSRLDKLNRFNLQQFHSTDRSQAVILMWFFVLLVWVSVSVLYSTSVCLCDFISSPEPKAHR